MAEAPPVYLLVEFETVGGGGGGGDDAYDSDGDVAFVEDEADTPERRAAHRRFSALAEEALETATVALLGTVGAAALGHEVLVVDSVLERVVVRVPKPSLVTLRAALALVAKDNAGRPLRVTTQRVSVSLASLVRPDRQDRTLGMVAAE